MGWTMNRALALTMASVLAVGVAACGDDDDGDGDAAATTTEAASGDEVFCDALVEFNSAVLGVELDDTSSEEDVQAAG
jgi:hypothetical protein